MACRRAPSSLVFKWVNWKRSKLLATYFSNGVFGRSFLPTGSYTDCLVGSKAVAVRWISVSSVKSQDNVQSDKAADEPLTSSENDNVAQHERHDDGADESQSTSENIHITQDTEKVVGESHTHEFQAETRQLLDIVAKSLYSERQVFIREIISNASDALEKLRHLQVTGTKITDSELPLEIRITTDDKQKTFTIQDTGIGMSKEEMIENLGTIARSGSKAFINQLGQDVGKGGITSNIIGQFGVGFYSTFMVADSVEVFSRSAVKDSPSHHWISDGTGKYEIAEAEGVERGTKIIIRLKKDSENFSFREDVQDIIKKYSNFVGYPIYVNGEMINTIQAIWTKRAKDITEEEHEEFYRFISGESEKPLYNFQYATDAPLNIRSIFYIPTKLPNTYLMGVSRLEPGVSLYSRRVLIQHKSKDILPDWLCFVKGVVDSEDIPLNLSRELLQDSALIRKLKEVLTSRILRYFLTEFKANRKKFEKFFGDFGLYFREGLVTTENSSIKEDIAKLFSFESSSEQPGRLTTLETYIKRMKPLQKHIYYLCAPNRAAAESSPYYEALKKKDIEVIFAYHPHDDIVLEHLHKFNHKIIASAENFSSIDEKVEDVSNEGKEDKEAKPSKVLSDEEEVALTAWIKDTLGEKKVKAVKTTDKLSTHPAMLTVPDMALVKRILKTADIKIPRSEFIAPTLEINPSHEVMIKLAKVHQTNAELAQLVIEQIYDNAMITAGIAEDPRSMIPRLNKLLAKSL